MDEDQGTVDYLVDVDLGANGGPVRAQDLDDLEQWVAREREFWSWCSGDQVAAEVRDVVNHVRNQLKSLNSELTGWKNSSDSLDKKKIASFIVGMYAKRKMLHSTSIEALTIEDVRERDGSVAASGALAMALSQPFTLERQRPILSAAVLQGATRMVMLMAGIDPKAPELTRRQLAETLDHYNKHINERAKQAEETQCHLDNLVNHHTDLRDRGLASMATAVRLARKQAQQQRAEVDKSLDDLVKLYNEKLSLDAPVDYWRKKYSTHGSSARIFFALFAALLAAGLGLGWWVVKTSHLGDLSFWESADLAAVALLTISVGIAVALVRVPLRLAMSELHLRNDADERVTMVQTYLALRAGEHATTDHMRIVLERLFKPATDGIVKDDLGPVTPADALGRALQR